MGVQNDNSTGYVHPDEPNLLNLHKAMNYNGGGEPQIRVSLGTENVTITGNVNVGTTVSVDSTPENPVHIHITEVGNSGLLDVPYLPINGNVVVTGGNVNANVSGNVIVTRLPAITGDVNANVSGNVVISGNANIINTPNVRVTNTPDVTGNVIVSGNVGILGNVNVTQGTDPWKITGNVNVTGNVNANVSGNVNANVSGNVNANVSGNVNITSMPEIEIKNDTGNPIPISANTSVNSATNRIYVTGDTDVTIANSNYEMNVARGLVPGQYIESKNGYATGINQGTEVTLWSNNTVYPWGSWAVAQKLYIISTSASDTGQVIRIEGLDASYNKITEDITTNGLTPVVTTQNFLRLNRGYIISGNSNVGTITERLISGTGTVVGSMLPGFARNKGGFFTIPNGYTAYILYIDCTQFRGGSGNIGGVLKIFTRTGAGPFLLQVIAEVVNGQYNSTLNVPLIAPEKTDIDFRIVVDGNGTDATCFWQMILIPN